MTRFARVVLPGQPYHVTHRGNRRGDVFFSDRDRRDYLDLLAAYARQDALDVWGWCLMRNHVHLLVVPRRPDSMALAIGRAHMVHARHVNRAQGWGGHLWANRFFSAPLDPPHLWTAIKYIELNPVRVALTRRAEDWPWSSARAHALGAPDPLLDPARPFVEGVREPLTGAPLPWGEWLARGLEHEREQALRRATLTGRPCGSEAFVRALEVQLGRRLHPAKRGPKPKTAGEALNE